MAHSIESWVVGWLIFNILLYMKCRWWWESDVNSGYLSLMHLWFEPPRDEIHKMAWAPSEDSDQPGHPPSLIRDFAARMKKACSLTTHWAHSRDSDQTGRMPSLIWVFAGRTVILLVLSRGGSFVTWHWHTSFLNNRVKEVQQCFSFCLTLWCFLCFLEYRGC